MWLVLPMRRYTKKNFHQRTASQENVICKNRAPFVFDTTMPIFHELPHLFRNKQRKIRKVVNVGGAEVNVDWWFEIFRNTRAVFSSFSFDIFPIRRLPHTGSSHYYYFGESLGK